MQIDLIKKYLKSPVKTPYFLFVGDSEYIDTINDLSYLGLDIVPMSSFCRNNDKLPDIDGLFTYIEAADVSFKGKTFVVTGLGELLAILGKEMATRTLSRLKDFNVGGAKVVLLLRGLASQIDDLQIDPRFDSRRFSVVDKAECDLSFTLAASSVGISAVSGFKALLVDLEKGSSGTVIVNTAVSFEKAMFSVRRIANAHEGIKLLTSSFRLPYSCGSEANWSELLSELNQHNSSFDDVFDKYGFGEDLESDFYSRIAGSEFRNWLYYIYLKIKVDILKNGYLRFVIDKTDRFEDLASNILNEIIKITHVDKRFSSFYQERKVLVEKYPESEIANFVVNNRQKVSESIYKLTDSTRTERQEIIAWISRNGVIPDLDSIYPILAAYLSKYIFKNSEIADLLTEYFEAYKRQKLSNKLEPNFLKKVDELALSREFNRLPTRNEIIDDVDKRDTYLYWLDAFGVEYLSLIEALVQKRGLSMKVDIARAELPTITSINRDFYDNWDGARENNRELDNTKHNSEGGYNFTNNELPIHLAKELEIIGEMIDQAATKLSLRQCKRFLIVSDHGASRLAVLRRKEEKYDTDTKGDYSGRCCKSFQPHDLPFVAEENGYLILADYGRFRGSRASNVEVHGGASLEEVVVPIIELSLKNRSITVKLVDDVVTVDYRSGTEITLFFNSPVKQVTVVVNGKAYTSSQIDSNHYSVKLSDIRRAGEYHMEVYAGDNLIGNILIKTQGKTGKVNDDFDGLF